MLPGDLQSILLRGHGQEAGREFVQVRVLQRLRRRRDLHPHRAHTGLVRIFCVYVCVYLCVCFFNLFGGGHGMRDEWMHGFIVHSKYTIGQRSKKKNRSSHRHRRIRPLQSGKESHVHNDARGSRRLSQPWHRVKARDVRPRLLRIRKRREAYQCRRDHASRPN